MRPCGRGRKRAVRVSSSDGGPSRPLWDRRRADRMGVGARLGIRTRTSRHRAGVLPLHQRAVGRASPNRRMPPSIRMVRGGPGAPGPASHHGCPSGCDGEARPPRGCDGTHRPARPGPPSRTAIRGERPQASRCVIRRSNRGQPRECGECIVCRHPGGLGQEPHAATQGTPPTAGWVSCPIPRTRWGVDGRADGMGTARPRIRCAGCASYSVLEPSALRPHERRP